MVELSSNASRKGFYVAVLPALPFPRVCGSLLYRFRTGWVASRR